MKAFFTVIVALLPHLVLSQNLSITGTVTEKESTKPLESVTVLIYQEGNIKDAAQSDIKGHYHFTLPAGRYLLKARLLGYDTAVVPIHLHEDNQLQNVVLTKGGTTLGVVQIIKQRPLIAIHGDTIIIDATQLRTPENASIRRLFERVPGLTKDDKGDYYYQGKKIQEITIDKRKSFSQDQNRGADPRKIEEMFRADLVSKIEITDFKSEDGKIEPDAGKTMNLQLKAEAHNKFTGSALAGKGTDDIYNVFGTGTVFKEKKQIMGLVRSNNANLLSGNELRPGIGSQPGRNTLGNGELSFNTDVNKKVTIIASASVARNRYVYQNDLERINLTGGDSSYKYTSASSNNTLENTGFYRLSTLLKVNEKTGFGFNTFVSARNTDNFSQSFFNNFSSGAGSVNNSGHIYNTEKGNDNFGDIGITFSRKGKSPVEGLFVAIRTGFKNASTNQININTNSNSAIGNTNQAVNPVSKSATYNVSIHYNVKIDTFFTTSFSATTDNDAGRLNQDTYDYDSDKKMYGNYNDSLSYRYKTVLNNKTVDGALIFRKGKLSINTRLAFIHIDNSSTNGNDNTKFQYNRSSFSPGMHGEYKFSPRNALRFFIDQRIEAPDLRRMMPIASLKNQNYIELGNPDLKPSKMTSGSVSYNSVQPTGITFSMDFMGFHQDNGLITNVSIDSSGRQISRAENANGIYNLTLRTSIGGQIRKRLTINLETFLESRHSPNYINGVKNTSDMNNVRVMLNTSLNHKEVDFSCQAVYMYSQSIYSLEKDKYSNSVYSINFNASTLTLFGIRAGTSAGLNGNSTMNQHYVLVSAWLEKAFFPNKSLEVKLYANDILNQNQSLRVEQFPTYVQNTTTNVLKRYGMLAVAYQFGKTRK